jgi:hypothetical protein
MMNRAYHLVFAMYLTLLCSCGSYAQGRKDKQATQETSEDVSIYRLKFNTVTKAADNNEIEDNKNGIEPKMDNTKELDANLDAIKIKNKRMKYAQGYRILVYTGSGSEESQKIKEQVNTLVTPEPVYSVYKQPTFRIKVGDYLTKVDAGGTLFILKKDFPNAIIVPDQITVLPDKTSANK